MHGLYDDIFDAVLEDEAAETAVQTQLALTFHRFVPAVGESIVLGADRCETATGVHIVQYGPGALLIEFLK